MNIRFFALFAVAAGGLLGTADGRIMAQTAAPRPAADVFVQRFDSNPLVTPQSDKSLGSNINGAAVIRVPP